MVKPRLPLPGSRTQLVPAFQGSGLRLHCLGFDKLTHHGNGYAALPIGARRYMQKVEIRVFCTKGVIIGLDPIICLKRFPGQARE
ncbi:MAG TPA: hypothetical protein DCZ76_10505 [Treponema sp.]|nr:hypothetical protein [Treponema sp.]